MCRSMVYGNHKLIIHENIYDTSIDLLKKSVDNIKVGSGFDKTNQMGPLNNRAQLDKMIDYVRRASDQGAEILKGPN